MEAPGTFWFSFPISNSQGLGRISKLEQYQAPPSFVMENVGGKTTVIDQFQNCLQVSNPQSSRPTHEFLVVISSVLTEKL